MMRVSSKIEIKLSVLEGAEPMIKSMEKTFFLFGTQKQPPVDLKRTKASQFYGNLIIKNYGWDVKYQMSLDNNWEGPMSNPT